MSKFEFRSRRTPDEVLRRHDQAPKVKSTSDMVRPGTRSVHRKAPATGARDKRGAK